MFDHVGGLVFNKTEHCKHRVTWITCIIH